MQSNPIEAVIFYRHRPSEVARIRNAIIPLAEHVNASSPASRDTVNFILKGKYFRVSESELMCAVLLKAANRTRAHLDDYFPLMREGLIGAAEELENAVAEYRQTFEELRSTSLPLE